LQKLGAFYGSCMDEPAIEKNGTKPIQPMLAVIKQVNNAKSLTTAITKLQASGANALFGFRPTEDAMDATQMIAGIDQAGIGLPDRDYYLQDSDQNKALRTAYQDYVAALLVEAGHKADAAKQEATDVLALETEIAKVSKDKVARRDPKGTYNK